MTSAVADAFASACTGAIGSPGRALPFLNSDNLRSVARTSGAKTPRSNVPRPLTSITLSAPGGRGSADGLQHPLRAKWQLGQGDPRSDGMLYGIHNRRRNRDRATLANTLD